MPLVSHPTTTLNRSQEAQYVYRSVKFLRIKLHPLDAPKSPLQAHHGLTKTRFSSINTVTEFDQAVYQEIRLCPITIPSWCSSHSRQKHPAQAVHFTAPLHSTLHCCVCKRNKSDKSWLHATARGTFLFLPQVSRQLWDYASLSGSVAHSLRHYDHQSVVSINRLQTRAGTYFRHIHFISSSQKLKVEGM